MTSNVYKPMPLYEKRLGDKDTAHILQEYNE